MRLASSPHPNFIIGEVSLVIPVTTAELASAAVLKGRTWRLGDALAATVRWFAEWN